MKGDDGPAMLWQSGRMSTELRVTLPGPEGSADARRALAILQKLVALLSHVEDAAMKRRTPKADDRSVWGFTSLGLGSTVCTLEGNRPRGGATVDTLANVAEWTVDGFAAAERRAELPRHWSGRAGSVGADLGQMLGREAAKGMILELLRNKHPVRKVIVTRSSGEHLRSALSTHRRSIGSVIGRLDTVTLHGKYEAGVWSELGGERAAIQFDADQVDQIRAAWGKRVEVAGVIIRDAEDKPLTVRMRSLEVLRDDGPPLAGLVGFDPDFTGGMDPGDYLRKLRDAS
ncbi:MAG TPA: hypothetical protein VIQ30_06655 [Pseudonocardia sp.]